VLALLLRDYLQSLPKENAMVLSTQPHLAFSHLDLSLGCGLTTTPPVALKTRDHAQCFALHSASYSSHSGDPNE